MATTILRPTIKDLERERDSLLAALAMDPEELRERASRFLLTADEARMLRRLDQIAFLLGED